MNQLTQEEKRVKIAEACGWKKCPRCEDPECAYNVSPNYLNNLNAMHEAEESLDCNQWEIWHRIVGEWPQDLAHLTATQRAEAFGRAKGLWE